jgi:GNAT superfamily N-acetyltransferase
MKLRTIRTFDELEAFYSVIRHQYPGYTYPRISAVHYGVFDVGEDAQGRGEGARLVAGAAIDVGGWDVFEEGGVKIAKFEHLIVKPEFRNQRIGTALLNFVVESHCDLEINGRVSKNGDRERLVSWYERFAFHVVEETSDEVFMERKPESDCEHLAPALREDAANRLYGEHRHGLDLSYFDPG